MRIAPGKLLPIAVLACGPLWGCGPGGSGTLPDAIPVKGKVTHKGKPLTQGLVKFLPDYGREARGRIQPDGTFVLTTLKEGDGAVVGEHRVSITELEKSLARDRTLKKYGSPNTSKLVVAVDPEHTEFTFDLK